MEEHEAKAPKFTSETGVLIPMTVVVVVALAVATLAVGESHRKPDGGWGDPILCQHAGIVFLLNLPEDVHVGDKFDLEENRADRGFGEARTVKEKYGWVEGGILKFKIYRENVRLGFLDVIVSDEKRRHHHLANWESLEVTKGRGNILFRFRHLAGDGEAGALMARIADRIEVVLDRNDRD